VTFAKGDSPQLKLARLYVRRQTQPIDTIIVRKEPQATVFKGLSPACVAYLWLALKPGADIDSNSKGSRN